MRRPFPLKHSGILITVVIFSHLTPPRGTCRRPCARARGLLTPVCSNIAQGSVQVISIAARLIRSHSAAGVRCAMHIFSR